MHATSFIAMTRPVWFGLLALALVFGAVGGISQAADEGPQAPQRDPEPRQVATSGALRVQPAYTAFGGLTNVPGAQFTITVTDSGRNTTFGPGNDTVTVRIRTNTNAFDNILISEDPNTAGFFSRTIDNINDVSTNDPIPGDTLTFRYTESASLGGTQRNIIINIIGTTATLTVTPATGIRGTNMTVRVVDGDMNRQSGGSNDQLIVRVRNQSTGGAFQNFTLNETALQGTFEGNIFNMDNTIPTYPFSVDDVLDIRYRDEFDASGLVNNNLNATHVLTGTDGLLTADPATSIAPTGVLTINVTDPDMNRTAGAGNDVIPAGRIIVRDLVTNNTINAQLNESGTVGIFQGQANLAPLNLNVGDQIQVEYTDRGTTADNGTNPDGTPTTVTRTFGPIAIGQGTNGVLTVPPSAQRGAAFEIRLVDPDLNTSAGNETTGGTMSIRICEAPAFNCINNTAIVLTELTTQQGTFVLSYSAMVADFPNVEVGDRLRVYYNDTPTASGNTPVTRTADILIGGLQTASIGWSPIAVQASQSSTIFVTDADRNVTPGGGNDTVQVVIWNITTNSPQNPYVLTETDAGVFSLVVNTGDGGLNSRDGHVIRARYEDTQNPSGVTQVLTADLNIGTVGATATLDAPDSVIVGAGIAYVLREPDRAGNDSVLVTITNTRTGDREERALFQRANEAGVFEGSIITALTPNDARESENDSIINAQPGDIIRVSYVDPDNTSGRDVTITRDTRIDSRRSPTAFCDQRTSSNNSVWNVAYYANQNLTDPAVVVTQESNMSINWRNTQPYRAVPADNWSARYTTTLNVTERGRFRFRIGVDDGVRFYVNDQLIIDQFVGGSFREFFADVNLEQGDNRFTIEMFDGAADAGLVAECLFLEDAVAVIDPSTQDARGNFDVDFLYPSEINFDEARAHVATGRLHVRANPTVQAERIDMVYLYQSFPILGVTDDNGWYLVDLGDDRTGWVATRYIYRNERTPVRIYPSWIGSEAELPNIEVTGYATSELVIRTTPRTGSEIGILPQDAAFRIVARSQSGAWYRIEYEGANGWVFSPYVVLTNGTVQDLSRE